MTRRSTCARVFGGRTSTCERISPSFRPSTSAGAGSRKPRSRLPVGSSEQPLAEGLLRKTVRSTIWTFGGQQATTVLALATSVAIGRLTDPSELGRYALASGIAQLISTASTLQAGGYYVVSPEADARLLRTGLTL